MSKDKSKKKKYKLQVMDIITIVFTAIILGIMGFLLYFCHDIINLFSIILISHIVYS